MRKSIFVFIVLGLLVSGCKKDKGIKLTPIASLNVINTIGAGKTVRLGNLNDSVTAYNYKEWAILAGSSSLYLYPTGDSTNPYYSATLPTNWGDIYSVFLSPSVGTLHNTGILIVKDTLPYHQDSTFGVRVVNTSNTVPISVKVGTSVDFSGLAYNNISAFKSYKGTYDITSMSFQIRDAVKDTLMATYTLSPIPRFFNCTLVWKGIAGTTGTTAPGILRVNNY